MRGSAEPPAGGSLSPDQRKYHRVVTDSKQPGAHREAVPSDCVCFISLVLYQESAQKIFC